MTPEDNTVAGGGVFASPARVAYRASQALSTAYSRHTQALRLAFAAVRTYNIEYPDFPLVVHKLSLDHAVKVTGFAHAHPVQPVPKGLAVQHSSGLLVPAAGQPGRLWRAVLRHHRARFPQIEDVFLRHGARIYTLTAIAAHTASLYDLGRHGLFITIAGGYSDPGPHLSPVPLEDFLLHYSTHTDETGPR